MTKTIPNYRNLVVNETHNSFDNGFGNSTIVINRVNTKPDTLYKCRAVLLDHRDCAADTSGIYEGQQK